MLYVYYLCLVLFNSRATQTCSSHTSLIENHTSLFSIFQVFENSTQSYDVNLTTKRVSLFLGSAQIIFEQIIHNNLLYTEDAQ